MADKYVVDQVTATKVGQTECWDIRMTRPDGNNHIYRMPKITLDARAAEYGIDSTDIETLIELSLHEIFFEVTQSDETNELTFKDGGPSLMSADSTQAARDAHLGRVKTCPVRITTRGNKVLDVIRNSHTPDKTWIDQHRQQVDTRRWAKRYGDVLLSVPAEPAKSAAGQMGRALGIKVTLPDLRQE